MYFIQIYTVDDIKAYIRLYMQLFNLIRRGIPIITPKNTVTLRVLDFCKTLYPSIKHSPHSPSNPLIPLYFYRSSEEMSQRSATGRASSLQCWWSSSWLVWSSPLWCCSRPPTLALVLGGSGWRWPSCYGGTTPWNLSTAPGYPVSGPVWKVFEYGWESSHGGSIESLFRLLIQF